MAVKFDVENIQPLADQMVLVSTNPDAKIGKAGLFGNEWSTVGILSAGSDVAIQRAVDEETTEGKGRGVVARRANAGDLTGSYEVLEENEVVRYIAFPDAVVKDGTRIELHSAKVAMLMTAFVDVRQNGTVAIRTTRVPASHRMETIGRNESPAGKQVTIGFRADGQKGVFEYREFRVEKDGSMTEITPKVFVDQSQITKADSYQAGEGKPEEIQLAQNEFSNPAPAGSTSTTTGGTTSR